jgi:hypothetical protein
MRKIDLIIIHCADTYPRMDIGVKEIDQWHKERGWKGVGYHYVIRRNGVIETGRPENEIGAHVTGHNRFSIGVCWVGGKGEDGLPQDNRTESQKQSLRSLIHGLHSKYPDAIIAGHSDFNNNKDCPCFNVQAEFGWLNVKNNNNERETNKNLEVAEREENEHRNVNISSSTRDESFYTRPTHTGPVGFHTSGGVTDSGLRIDTQGGENKYSTEFYEDKIEKSIRSQIKWRWSFSIPIQKIINFFKQLKRR